MSKILVERGGFRSLPGTRLDFATAAHSMSNSSIKMD